MSQPDIHASRILILDFGGQYTQLIARRVREAGVFCEIHPWDITDAEVAAFGADGIILSGGPESAIGDDAPVAPSSVFESGVPVLGICYGMQTMEAQLGGAVESGHDAEFGYAMLDVVGPCAILDGLNDADSIDMPALDVWMSHGDRVTAIPEGFATVGRSDNAPIAAMCDASRRFFGVQFHPEVTHTKQGQVILSRFIHDVCGCAPLWTSANIIDDSIAQVRESVGDDHVLLGLSGGVDSSVVAALLARAIGDQLTCVFVDTGLLRHEEGDQVMETFARNMGINVIRVNAGDRFFNALAGETDPEAKRKIIGRLFIEVFDEEAQKIPGVKWLAQGTIYPDVIESAGAKTGKAKVIKSHHNVGGLPEKMNLKLVEPLRELFKDEVRRLGIELGLPEEMVMRHPFPGPGLGVRILGEVKKEYADVLRLADHILISELRAHDLYDDVSQAFAVFLPVRSVGVVGDYRSYDWVISLRSVNTIDFMTAHWSRLPYDFLDVVSRRIINEVDGVSRVTYDISSKPPATIEWE
ncbi:MAG: glutamine-hydrolyzing GMP synthase [Pseudomonadota bacterium]